MSEPVVIGDATLYLGDVLAVLATLPDESVHCVVTSPPYWGLRDYGVPWEKEIERTKSAETNNVSDVRREQMGKDKTAIYPVRYEVSTRVTGEHPTCTCGLPPVPGTVMDIFGGSGTVAEVALEYGRRAILIELKSEYVELAKRRIKPVAGRPMLAF